MPFTLRIVVAIRCASSVGVIVRSFSLKLIEQLGVDIRWPIEPGSMLRSHQRVSVGIG